MMSIQKAVPAYGLWLIVVFGGQHVLTATHCA